MRSQVRAIPASWLESRRCSRAVALAVMAAAKPRALAVAVAVAVAVAAEPRAAAVAVAVAAEPRAAGAAETVARSVVLHRSPHVNSPVERTTRRTRPSRNPC